MLLTSPLKPNPYRWLTNLGGAIKSFTSSTEKLIKDVEDDVKEFDRVVGQAEREMAQKGREEQNREHENSSEERLKQGRYREVSFAMLQGIDLSLKESNQQRKPRSDHPVTGLFTQEQIVGREKEMDDLYKRLVKGTNPSGDNGNRLVTCNLYGAPAMGKSSLAKAFAQKYGSEFYGIFWVNADPESGTETLRTYSDIGWMLNLYDTQGLSEAHIIPVWNWLQTTNKRWLLIFDNYVDTDADRMKRFWPQRAVANSVVLVTSQIEAPDIFVPKTHRIAVDGLNEVTGSELLLQGLNLPQSERAKKLAQAVVYQLGASPLFIRMAQALLDNIYKMPSLEDRLEHLLSQMKSTNLVPYMKEKKGVYKTGAKSILDKLIDSLETQEKAILYMLAFFGPDDIDEALFVSLSDNTVHGDFMRSVIDYESCILQLKTYQLVHQGTTERTVTTTLISREKDGHQGAMNNTHNENHILADSQAASRTESKKQDSLFMHRSTRLVLLAQLDRMPDERDAAFSKAITILRCHFKPPSKLQIANSEVQRLQTRVLPHLMSIAQVLKQAQNSEKPIRGSVEAAQLIAEVGGFDLYDCRQLDEALLLGEVAEKMLDKIDSKEVTELRSDILTIRGLCTDNMALSQRANGLRMRKECLDMRKKLFADIAPEDVQRDDIIRLYNSYTDLICSYQQINDFQEVDSLLAKCLEAYQKLNPNENSEDVVYEYAKYHNQKAYILLWEGRGAEAVENAKLGAELAEKASPGTNMSLVFAADHAHILFQSGGENIDLRKQGQEQGCRLLQDLLEKSEELSGENSMQSLEFRLNIGIMQYFMGNLEEAE